MSDNFWHVVGILVIVVLFLLIRLMDKQTDREEERKREYFKNNSHIDYSLNIGTGMKPGKINQVFHVQHPDGTDEWVEDQGNLPRPRDAWMYTLSIQQFGELFREFGGRMPPTRAQVVEFFNNLSSSDHNGE